MTANQPTILIKKADGSHVRLTMEEFRKYQASKQNGGLSNKVIEKLSGEKTNLPVKAPVEALATSAPVKEIFVDEAKYVRTTNNTKLRNTKRQTVVENKKWTREDHKSLLEETGEEVKKKPAAASLPSTRDDACAQVVNGLKFSISDELMPRLWSLIVSRIKDIRSDEQAEAYALREVKNGGLGLNAAQAGELKKAINAQIGGRVIKRSEEQVRNKEIKKLRNLETEKLEEKPHPTLPYKGRGDAGKPIIQDVTAPFPPGKQTIGPVEELGAMTLVNFRRLAADPFIAGKIAREKFKELKTESYLLYLDAVKAWRQSPLYRQYLAVMAEAINRRQRINVLLASNNKEQLKENEFMALVEVNEYL